MKKILKTLLISLVVLSVIFMLSACIKDEPTVPSDPTTDQNTAGDNNNNSNGGGSTITPTPLPDKDGISSTENIFVFELNSTKDGYVLKNIAVKSNPVVIPDSYGTKAVTEIAPMVFYSNEALTDVSIPDSVKIIGERAFSACVNLKSVTFGANPQLTNIGDRAFFNCERLVSLSIPLSVKDIGTEAFANCLDYAIADSQDALATHTFTSVGYGAFHNTKWYNECLTGGAVRVGNCAYGYAYNNHQNGQAINIEYTDVAIIGEKALYGAKDIVSVHIGAGVTHIGAKALCNMPALQTITVDSANEYYSSNGNCLIEKATNKVLAATATTTIPDGITTIGSEAYAFRQDIGAISLPSSVATIEPNAFEGSSLTGIAIPSSVTIIDERVFLDCANLQSIHIQSTVTEIKNAAFNGCTALKEVTIDSDDILALCTGKLLSPAGIMSEAEVVYVKEGLESTSPYLVASFNIVTSDKAGYIKYQIIT